MTEWVKLILEVVLSASAVANYFLMVQIKMAMLQIKLGMSDMERRAEIQKAVDLAVAQRWAEDRFVRRPEQSGRS